MHVLVEAHLAAPVALHVRGDRIPLDSVLLAAMGARDDGDIDEMAARLPLLKEKFTTDGKQDYYYRCSDAFFINPRAFQTSIRRLVRGFLDEYADEKVKINTSSGPYKMFNIPRMAVAAEKAVWTAETNSIDELEELLEYADFIGAWTSKGYGEIAEWRTTPLQGAWRPFTDGVLLRGVPLASIANDVMKDMDKNGLVRDFRAWRTPYYKTTRGECIAPAWSAIHATEQMIVD